MRIRLKLTLLVIAALALTLPATASAARYVVGIGEQNAAIFDQPLFQQTGVKRVRYLVPWDWNRVAGIKLETEAFIDRASADGQDIFVTFTAKRGCWTGRYSRSKACRAPKVRQYKKSVREFRARFPQVRTYAPWNEANHASQPTSKKPKLAAKYYNAMRKLCRGCKLVALDILDQSDAIRYLKKFRRKAKGSPRRWGLHNYSDVNRKRPRSTRKLLRKAKGEVWLTETGGIVSFEPNFPYSETRAKKRTKYMFRLAKRFSRKRGRNKSRITRVYPYSWFGSPRGARFDAGLVNPDGSPRKALSVYMKKAARARR